MFVAVFVGVVSPKYMGMVAVEGLVRCGEEEEEEEEVEEEGSSG